MPIDLKNVMIEVLNCLYQGKNKLDFKDYGFKEEDQKIFYNIVDQMSKDKLIEGVSFAHGGTEIVAYLDNVKITTFGVDYLEQNKNGYK